jgi:FtsZ-binding cell division protein ZapB
MTGTIFVFQPQIEEVTNRARQINRELTGIQQQGNRIVDERRHLTAQAQGILYF